MDYLLDESWEFAKAPETFKLNFKNAIFSFTFSNLKLYSDTFQYQVLLASENSLKFKGYVWLDVY